MPRTTDRPGQGPERRPERSRSSGSGRFVRSEESAVRDAEACTLRTAGLTYAKIAERLGYADHSAARKAVERALAATVAEPAARLRTLELNRLDAATVVAFQVLTASHVTVSNGRVIMDPGNPSKPLVDHGPKLAAIDRIVRLSERRSRLCGLDAPVRVEVPTVDQVEAEIARLAAQLELNDPKGTTL